MDINVADTMPDGWQRWLDWHRVIAPDNELEISALEADRGSFLGYVHLAGRRRAVNLTYHAPYADLATPNYERSAHS